MRRSRGFVSDGFRGGCLRDMYASIILVGLGATLNPFRGRTARSGVVYLSGSSMRRGEGSRPLLRRVRRERGVPVGRRRAVSPRSTVDSIVRLFGNRPRRRIGRQPRNSAKTACTCFMGHADMTSRATRQSTCSQAPVRSASVSWAGRMHAATAAIYVARHPFTD